MVELDFNEQTSTFVAFICVKIRIVFTDRLRFFRRVRFESIEGAMTGFEYERLRRICTNSCRINHPTDNCPLLAAHVVYHDEEEVLEVPAWEEGNGSNNIMDQAPGTSSESSDISSSSPISKPPPPVSPSFHDNEAAMGSQPSRLFQFHLYTSLC